MSGVILDNGIFPLGGNELVLPRESEGVMGSLAYYVSKFILGASGMVCCCL